MTISEQRDERFRWDRLTVSVALGYCMLVVALSAGVVLAELRDEFGINGTIAALHGSAFGFGLLFMALFGVRIMARIGRHVALRSAVVMMVVGAVAFGTGRIWEITLAGTAVAGFGAALYVLIVPGLIHDHHGEHRSTAFAAVNALPLLMAMVLSLSIGVSLSLTGTWRTTYFVIVVTTVIVVAVVAGRVQFPEADELRGVRFSVFRDRDVLVPWLFLVNAVLVEFMISVWAASYLREIGGASSGVAAALAGTFGVAMFGSRILLPRLVELLGARTIAVGFVGVAAGASIMCFAPTLIARVLGLVIVGFAMGPLYPLCVERLFARAEATVGAVAIGAVSAFGSGVGITTGPLLAGVVADAVGLRWSMLATAVVALVGAITQHEYRRSQQWLRRHRASTHQASG